mgnify:CR=1 FL=1
MKITNLGPSGINPYQREQQKTELLKKKAGPHADSVEISREAISMQKQTDPARLEKIANLKAKIEKGTYSINYEKLAKKMIQYYSKNE